MQISDQQLEDALDVFLKAFAESHASVKAALKAAIASITPAPAAASPEAGADLAYTDARW
jgi:hypothetical protein